MHDIEAIGPAIVLVGVTLVVLILNGGWIVQGFRYRGIRRRVITRALWFYFAIPAASLVLFAVSVFRSPVLHYAEPFGSDGRPIGYVLVMIIYSSLVAAIGLVLLTQPTKSNQEEPNFEGSAALQRAAGPRLNKPVRQAQGSEPVSSEE
jgi:hypothetical protein